MVSRSQSVLVALIPAFTLANAFAAENPETERAALGIWSVEQLCDARDNPEALREIERRDIFDSRELRAIRRERVRNGISEDALRCMMGSPQTILRSFTTVEDGSVDAFVFPPGTIGSLIVYLMREGDESVVVASTESIAPYVIAAAGTGAATDLCEMVGPASRPREANCSGRGGWSEHERAVHQLASKARGLPTSVLSQVPLQQD
jgi:hypothetical protein